MLYLWVDYFEVLSGVIDLVLVMHFLREHLKLVTFSKTLPPLNQNAFFLGGDKSR